MSEQSEAETDRISKLRDPSNFEFMRSPSGSKIHIVGTGLAPSLLAMGKKTSGDVPDGAEKALCGLVTTFEDVDEMPEGVNDVLDAVCTRCNRQAGYIRNRGKFEEVPL